MTALLATLAIIVPGDHATNYKGCNTDRCVARVQRRMRARTRRRWKRTVAPYDAHLERMAWCESTHRWHIANHPYYGGLQFTLPSWAVAGGSGFPHHATPLEQKYRAVRLSRLQGWGRVAGVRMTNDYEIDEHGCWLWAGTIDLNCEEPIVGGRRHKRFCDQRCRWAYNNHRRGTVDA